MAKLTRRNLLAVSALAPLVGGVMAATSGEEEKKAAGLLSPRDQIRARYFPNVVLYTQEGKAVRFYDDLIKGKIVTINFMYAKCEGVCPLITANLARVQRLFGNRVGREIFMYSFTLKPELDTPKALKMYMEMHNIGPGWTYLTGKPSDMELLRRKLGFTNPDPKLDADSSQHIGNVRYGNEPLMLWAACPGMASPSWIVKSISWVMQPQQPYKP
jgi:protein SCO1/2